MSIDRINRSTYVNAYSSNYNKTVDKTNNAKEVDRIEISAIGKSLNSYSLDNKIDNSKKIAEIKNKIENGTYNVDAKLTAQSMLNAMKESNS